MIEKKKSVAIIGAGLGGISAAVSLATAGYDVILFEKNDRIGGKLNILEKGGFKFDLGPSILILPQIFRQVFDFAGKDMDDYVKLVKLEPQWRTFFEDDTIVDLYGDIADMERELSQFDWEDVEGWFSYIDHSRKLWNFANEVYFQRGADTLKEIMHGYSKLKLYKLTDFRHTMAETIDKFIKNPYLSNIANFFLKYIGSSSYNAPGIFNLMMYSQLGYGEWYVEGGMYNLAKAFHKLLDEIGVKVNLNSEVVEIRKNGDNVSGITLANGELVCADIIVSNMEVIPAYDRLLHEDERFMARYRKRFEPAASGIVLHLGMDKRYPNLAHHNFFFSQDLKKHLSEVYDRKLMPQDPTIYLVAPTRTDPTIAPKGHEIIKILPHIPPIQDKPFEQADYDLLKERVYDKLERMGIPDLRKHIVVEDMLIPEDIERMYYSNRGAIYGIVADKKKNMGFRAPKRSELYRNLYFVGGSVNPGSGMPMAIFSGQMIRDKIIEDFGK